jgi:ribose 1,5-bisphosphokinase
MSGRLVLVVGPSGAGKDTLIAAAKAALADDRRFVFPRRVVTREAIAALEDHDSVSAAEFALREAQGAYALSWAAHGLRYGLPARLVDDLAAGRVIVVNASRTMIGAAEAKFAGTRIIAVEAAPEIRASRLTGRGRESKPEVAARLAREVGSMPPGAIRIDNSGTVADGSSSFIGALRQLASD